MRNTWHTVQVLQFFSSMKKSRTLLFGTRMKPTRDDIRLRLSSLSFLLPRMVGRLIALLWCFSAFYCIANVCQTFLEVVASTGFRVAYVSGNCIIMFMTGSKLSKADASSAAAGRAKWREVWGWPVLVVKCKREQNRSETLLMEWWRWYH